MFIYFCSSRRDRIHIIIYNILPLQAEHFYEKKPPPPVSKELLSYQKIKLTERQLHPPPKQKMKTLKQNNKQIDKKNCNEMINLIE